MLSYVKLFCFVRVKLRVALIYVISKDKIDFFNVLTDLEVNF